MVESLQKHISRNSLEVRLVVGVLCPDQWKDFIARQLIMRYWVQYHSYESNGVLPGGCYTDETDIALMDTRRCEFPCVDSVKPLMKKAHGGIVFLIVGYGKTPKKYVLWCWIKINKIEETNDYGKTFYHAMGKGKILYPLPILEGKDFDDFYKWNNNFSFGFREITNHPYLSVLIGLMNGAKDLKEKYILTAGEVKNSAGYKEGTLKRVFVNSYERSKRARRECLNHYGRKCYACGIDPNKTFAFLGKLKVDFDNGIIQVHHKIPLSQIPRAYKIDPIKDLVPLCPNCHSIVHLQDPPISVENIKKFYR